MTDKLADKLKELVRVYFDPTISDRETLARIHSTMVDAEILIGKHEATKAATPDDVREATQLETAFLCLEGSIGGLYDPKNTSTVSTRKVKEAVDWVKQEIAALRNTQGVPREVEKLRELVYSAHIHIGNFIGRTELNGVFGGAVPLNTHAKAIDAWLSEALAILDQHARGG